jgi:hypothetical protein
MNARFLARRVALIAVIAIGGAAVATACSQPAEHEDFPPGAAGNRDAEDFSAKHVPPPPISAEMWPCTQCHDNKDLTPNPTRRTLISAHDDIQLRHDEKHRWCLDCHDAQNRDTLRLASGAPVPFERSYELCGQCHGDKYRDWRAGVHGRRTGMWNGEKQYLLCVNCHNSHAPRFKPLKPEPMPIPPGRRKTP